MRTILVLALIAGLTATAGCASNTPVDPAAASSATTSATITTTTTDPTSTSASSSADETSVLQLSLAQAKVPTSCTTARSTTKACYDSIYALAATVLQLQGDLTSRGGRAAYPKTFAGLDTIQEPVFRYTGLDAKPCYPTGNDQCAADTATILDGARSIERALQDEFLSHSGG